MGAARWKWIQQFANRLLQLEPTCPESIAVAVGTIAYDTDFSQLPQHAAEFHVTGPSPLIQRKSRQAPPPRDVQGNRGNRP